MEYIASAMPEIREDNGKPVIFGYAVVWGDEYRSSGRVETVAKGAFSKHLATGADVRALQMHDKSKILARTKAGNLLVKEDQKGLYYELTPSDTSYAKDLVANIRAGNVGGSSFGFNAVNEKKTWRTDGRQHREITEAILHEVTITDKPAYPGTSVGVREAEDGKQLPEFPARLGVRRFIEILELES